MKNAEFWHPILAQIYENFNQFSEDEDFWVQIIWDLWVTDITDFWCGTWLFTSILWNIWYQVRWIEPVKQMLEIAKSKGISSNIEWILWDYKEIKDFNTDLFLMTSHVSQFITDLSEWNQLLKNCYSVLNHGGYILFDTKNPLIKPWKKYTRESYNKTKNTKFWPVNMQIETLAERWNTVTHAIYYDFLHSWEKLISHNTLIYRTKDELVGNLENVGFTVKKIYWDWDFWSYNDNCEEIIFLAQKI